MSNASDRVSSGASTLLGVIAVVFWSASIGLNRLIAEALGPVTASAAIALVSGLIGCSALVAHRRLREAFAQPARTLLTQGALFIVYFICFSLAVGLSRGKQQLIEIGLVNYLWPGVTLALSVPLLGNKARWTLLPGIALSLAGVLVSGANSSSDGMSAFLSMGSRVAADPVPYVLCLVNVLAWSLYSNLTRSQRRTTEASPTPLYLLLSGVCLAVVRIAFPEKSSVDAVTLGALGFMAIFPALLSYWAWEKAMRSGNMTLVTSLSYLIPLFSTVITASQQKLALTPASTLGCGLLIAGAWLCQRSIEQRTD